MAVNMLNPWLRAAVGSEQKAAVGRLWVPSRRRLWGGCGFRVEGGRGSGKDTLSLSALSTLAGFLSSSPRGVDFPEREVE